MKSDYNGSGLIVIKNVISLEYYEDYGFFLKKKAGPKYCAGIATSAFCSGRITNTVSIFEGALSRFPLFSIFFKYLLYAP